LEYGAGLRSEVLSFLVTMKGARVWRKTESERRFHLALGQTTAGELRDLLDTIGAYEGFARLLQDAFDDCIHKSSVSGGRLKATQFARLEGVRRAASQVHKGFYNVLNRLEGYGQADHFRDRFERFSEKHSAAAWVEGLLEHHFETQHRKPPDGKAPWFARFDGGSVIVRSAYRRDGGAKLDDSYVHGYRTPSLWTFAQDLRLVRNG
jgi:hypothetical protein